MAASLESKTLKILPALLGLPIPPTLAPHYNIAPSQPIACVRTDPQTAERKCIELKWGLVPSWAKDGSIGNKMINARSETAAEKPSFKNAFKQQRCVVLADGFFEWKREGKAKEPYYFRFKDRRPFCFAGLWERWDKRPEDPLETCAMLTIGPNTLMKPINHRMPVILQEKDYETWLDPKIQDPRFLACLLQPYPPEDMEAFPVSPIVNNPKNDSERCIELFG
mgnify:CR=1 FL=1